MRTFTISTLQPAPSMKMSNSYTIGGTLVDNPRDALIVAIEEWLYAGGLNNTETVAGFDPQQAAQEWLEECDGFYEAQIVGRLTEDGDPVYEHIDVSLETATEIAADIIRGASKSQE